MAVKKIEWKPIAIIAGVSLLVTGAFAAFNMDSKVKAFKAKHSKKGGQ